MKPYIAISCIFTAFLLSACATTPVPNADAKPVPKERVIDNTFLQPNKDYGTVIIKRDNGFKGNLCSTLVFVNAKAVADLHDSEKITIFLPEGEYVFSSTPTIMCSGSLSETMGIVKAGKQSSYRIGWDDKNGFRIFPTAF